MASTFSLRNSSGNRSSAPPAAATRDMICPSRNNTAVARDPRLTFNTQEMRNTIAQGFGADPNEIVMSFNTTDGMSKIFAGCNFAPGDEIISIFDEGTYEFAEGKLPSREVILLHMSTPDLLLEGIRRVERWSRLRAGVGPIDQRYALSSASAARVSAVSLRDFVLGTAVGVLPGTVGYAALGASAGRDATTFVVAGAVAAALLVGSLLLGRRMARRNSTG